jgi:hypothetical protein
LALPLLSFRERPHHSEVVLAMRKSRVLRALGLALVTVALLAASASADPNPNSGRVPVTPPPDDVFTDICPFPVLVETVAIKEYSKTHKNGV